RDENRIIFSDFAPLATISSDQPGSFADLEYSSSFDDRNAVEPLGITVNQTSYGWANLPDDSYIITVYEITNDSDVDLNGLRIAHYEDWDMPWIGLGNDKVNFDRQRNLGYQHYINFYRGMMVLNNEGACSFKALRNESEVDPPYFSLYDKWSYMNAGFSDTAITEPENASMMLTTGPFDIPSGSTVIAAFAILGANHLDNLQELADAAQSKYDMMTDINERPVAGLPIAFGIQDCYPNPFNPSAAIKFALDKSGQVELVIYDALGRRVKSLVDEPKETGLYKVSWDGRNYAGNRVASGVYFARLRCDEQKAVEKIVLLR
ncbi:MAG: T9SS type A sorting domain-containing protein, partial [candidate division Zixibacteria bacterium]|nr:T9SS type A sorting domain-containing protein [candidate division Zixibacteria bacterium]